MRKETVDRHLRDGLLRRRSPDFRTVKTLLESAGNKAKAAKLLPLKDCTATLIFLGIYESIRQLGDAKWRLEGYESLSHDASMRILAEADVKEKLQLQKLDRFRRVRNDANYRGHKVTLEQANEILEFWEKCGEELAKAIEERGRH